MKTILKYTLATFVVTVSMLATNANALLAQFTCTEKLGQSQKDKDLKSIQKCAAEHGNKHPKFIAALMANTTCIHPTGGWIAACKAAAEHHESHSAVASHKNEAAQRAKNAVMQRKLKAEMDKQQKVVDRNHLTYSKSLEKLDELKEKYKAAGGVLEEEAAPAEEATDEEAAKEAAPADDQQNEEDQ